MTETILQPSDSDSESRVSDARRLLAISLVVGLLFDLSVQTRADGTALFCAVAVLVVAALVLRDVTSGVGRLLVVASLAPALFLVLNRSPWVLGPSLVLVLVLLALGMGLARSGGLSDMGFVAAGRRISRALAAAVVAPFRIPGIASLSLTPSDSGHRQRLLRLLRGAAIAVPVAVVIGLLLASADGVFASLFDISVDPASILAHTALIAAGAWIATGLFLHSATSDAAADTPRRLAIGRTEAAVVLGALIVVYGLYALTVALVARRGSQYVLETTGLTYAEYARSGFFQLLWASGITLVVLLVLRSGSAIAAGGNRSRILDGLSLAAVALTLVVIGSALNRLALYEDAFGLTMLRLYSTAFAWWTAVVFVLVAVSFFVYRKRNWLPAAVMASALIGVVFLNATDPETVVVHRNVERAAEGSDFDVKYALGLSDDSVPALVDALPRLSTIDRERLLEGLCADTSGTDPTEWNFSAARAEAALARVCPD